MMDKTDEGRLIADLQAAFPDLSVRPLVEFGLAEWSIGVWTGGDACMSDGEQIFGSLAINDPDRYNGSVHHDFEAWCEQRGWMVQNYDGATHFIVPAPAGIDALQGA